MFCALLGQDIRRAFTGPMVLWFQFVLNRGYACAMIVHARADQLLPQLLMETFFFNKKLRARGQFG